MPGFSGGILLGVGVRSEEGLIGLTGSIGDLGLIGALGLIGGIVLGISSGFFGILLGSLGFKFPFGTRDT